jgi:hypothetical protein
MCERVLFLYNGLFTPFFAAMNILVIQFGDVRRNAHRFLRPDCGQQLNTGMC